MAITVKFTAETKDLESGAKKAEGAVDAFGNAADDAGAKAAGAFDRDLEQSLARIEEATMRAAKSTETLASHAGGMNEVAEAFGNTERLVLGVNDVLGVMSEQFGVNIGPAQEWAQAAGDVAGGLEGIIGGGMALAEQLGPLAAKMGPVITSTWAHVTALYAQAAAFVAANLPIVLIIGSIALLAAGVLLLIKYWDPLVEKFPILGEIMDEVQLKLAAFKQFLTGPFLEALQALWNKFDFVFKAIEIIVMSQVKAWQIVFETAFDVILGIIDVFAGIFTGDMGRVKDGVLKIFGALWDGAEAMFKLGIDAIKNLAPLLLEAGKELGGAVKDGFVAAINGAVGLTGDIGNALIGLFENAINWVIGSINDAMPNQISVPHLPDIDLPDNPIGKVSIPRLAKGGIVTDPTLALIGEAGPEAVIPLSSANARGGSLLGIGNAPAGVRGGTSAADPKMNLSLSELKSIKDHTSRTEEHLGKAVEALETIAKAVYSGKRSIGDSNAGIEEGQEVLALIWQMLREIRDLIRDGNLTPFGDGAAA